MFDFIIRGSAVGGGQRFIERLQPKVNIHIPKDLPLPSVGIIKRKAAIASRISALESSIAALSNEQLRAKTDEFRTVYAQAVAQSKEYLRKLDEEYYQSKTPQERENINVQIDEARAQFKKIRQETLDKILPEAFAVVREASKRTIGLRHFDVQMVGGMVLHDGRIAEMTTGEGKTLVATLPAYLNAITGDGVHVVTVNDYLAKRDAEWMGPIYKFLGLTVGVVQHDIDNSARRRAYGCDITYGTNNEFGFDYLRDNMVSFKEEMVQRGFHFAIVDEVDSILVDEARTPLIISGPAEESTDKYYKANTISHQLKGRRITDKDEIDAKYKNINLGEGYDYVADEKAKSVALTEEGEQKIARMFGVSSLHDMETIEYRHHILQALRAKEFFKLDVDYVARDGKVVIVDEFTGRLMPGRRWSDGLHQAVEAKEGIRIERENQTLATVSFQNYFRMYDKLAGMTGTAYTEANEFKEIYNLDCVVMPTNRILQRKSYADCIYRSVREKFSAVVTEIEDCYKRGQPVLVGTISIEKSELVSRLLTAKGIAHKVLNAKFHEQEAHIIAQAGRYKAVTIATNMAGRGTDIVLGGNAEHLARQLATEQMKETDTPEERESLIQKFIEQFTATVKEERQKVLEAGGLHVLGTERHESRRIDNQLRGRCGRQGDPGSSRFYVSLEDDLMRLFASDRIMAIMDRMGMAEGEVIEHPLVSKALEVAQKRVENHNFEIRKHLIEYDNVMNKQREAIYGLRRSILEGKHVQDLVTDAFEDTVDLLMQQFMIEQADGSRDVSGLTREVQAKFGLALSEPELGEKSNEEVRLFLSEALRAAYAVKEQEFGAPNLRQLERFVLLQVIDSKWKDHLYSMDHLKESIGLRAYGQRDPLLEYKKEGFAMFEGMFDLINEEIVTMLFRLQSVQPQERQRSVFSILPKRLEHEQISGMPGAAAQPPSAPAVNTPVPQPQPVSRTQPVSSDAPRAGRNDPCPCGSGLKYKKCCGK